MNSATISQSLAGRTALICGASKGIGRATARALAATGARTLLLARSEDALRSLLVEITDAGGDGAVFVADLDDRRGLDELVVDLRTYGPIHVLVNNSAGPPGGPLLAASADELLVAFGRHVLAGHLLVQALLPGMIEAGYGRIINVISTSVREPIVNLGVSNTIRGAMASWAKSLSRELPPGVTINNVLPGFTDTARLASLGEKRAAQEGTSIEAVQAAWLAEVPERRLAQPEETAAAIAFLASPAAAYIRGTSLPVDGGRLRSI